jgi:DNA-binding ferritin-like protein (Dps family)
MILIGKCLELYSRHYGAVIDHEEKSVPLGQALEEIKMFVDQLVTKEKPLPGELADIDPESYVYLISLCEKKEIKSDEVHKATRGIMEIDDLIKAGLLIKGRTKGGRTYEVKTPMERFSALAEKLTSGTEEIQKNLFGEAIIPPSKKKEYFIDKVHFLMGLAEAKESLLPWIERWRGESREIRAACAYISAKKNEYAPILGKILKMMESGPLFR